MIICFFYDDDDDDDDDDDERKKEKSEARNGKDQRRQTPLYIFGEGMIFSFISFFFFFGLFRGECICNGFLPS